MVYLHFPSKFTEEELMLQAKYAKLKKKKLALAALKAPKPEPEKPVLPARAGAARDAREVARKLLKSGAIQAIRTPPPLPHNTTFKRPRAGRERKLSGTGLVGSGSGVASYQPFSAAQDPSPEVERTPPRVKNLYDSFVVAREKEVVPALEKDAQPRTGCTVYVCAARLTEEVVRRVAAPHGNVVSLNLEPDSKKGFITYDRSESAAAAISALNGLRLESGSTMRASLARRQLRHSEGSWPRKDNRPNKDNDGGKREQVVYDDIFDP